MNDKYNKRRRNFLKKSIIFGSLIVADWLTPPLSFSECNKTPSESSGPFYPLDYPLDQDNDLTYLKDKSRIAKGDIIYIKGLVRDEGCKPVSKAIVEIWQACTSGRYNHPEDQSSAKLDPNFQYWGKAITNEHGEYEFKTIKPGSYPVNWFWTRPPHIHFTVRSIQYHELTTQMYFSAEPLNHKDRLLQGHSKEDQERCIVKFTKRNQIEIGQFNLTLKTIGKL